MKIFPLKFLSPADRVKTLMNVMSEAKTKKNVIPDYNRKITIMNSNFTVRELRSIYKDGLELLSSGKPNKTKG